MIGADRIEDRFALRALAERYARGVDTRDRELFLGAFHEDAELVLYGDPTSDQPTRTLRGHEEIGAVTTAIAVYERTLHLLGQSTYELGDGVATGLVYCAAHHLTPDRHGGTTHIMYMHYVDDYRLGTDGEWRIAIRRPITDWTGTHAANPLGR